MQTPAFLVLFMAPVYVPLDLLTTWIHTLATVNPVTAFLEAARGFLDGDPVKAGVAFGAAAGLIVVMGTFALSGLRKAERAC